MGNSCLPIPFHPNKVQIIPVTVFRKNASEESPGVMTHDHLMVASAGSWFVLCRFSLFCPGEIFSNNTHLPQGDIIFIGRYFQVMAHKPRIQAAARLPGGRVLLKRLPLTSSRVDANQNAASVTLQLCPPGHLRVQRRFCHPSGEY